jgi:SAM-dependent methyltransferase
MATIDVDRLKATHRATWASGDYAAVSDAITDQVAPLLVERAPVQAGQAVLDVATGTGNVALRAAQTGASVTGVDLTPELFTTARRRAGAFGVSVDWVEGDAESLPFDDGQFDRVFSAFGVQFAPRHEQAAAELVRVCRPGGLVALANWTPEGQVGDLFRIMGRYLPPPPAFASPPAQWGNEDHVRDLLGADLELEFARPSADLRFDSADAYVAFMETAYGPTIAARERLTAEGRWDACRRELVEMMEGRNTATDGTLAVAAEYLLVVGRRPA